MRESGQSIEDIPAAMGRWSRLRAAREPDDGATLSWRWPDADRIAKRQAPVPPCLQFSYKEGIVLPWPSDRGCLRHPVTMAFSRCGLFSFRRLEMLIPTARRIAQKSLPAIRVLSLNWPHNANINGHVSEH